ncbi:hypothetical protein B5S33_g1124 [[Candida] boidinii]|nr:hypothetical protein B5S30_g425 [[Candida] boidinii]OWB82498.1 hypothetical protein B5S33_g1124 [[Candida] boidinii]
MAPSTSERSRKSSPEHIKSSVAPTTPAVEQPAPVVTTGVGSISTLSEGINQPFDSEEVCTDISYDEDSPSSDESDLVVGKHKKRKHSKRGLREFGFESESESEDQNRKKNVSFKSKYLKELTIEEKRAMKRNQMLKDIKLPEFTFSSEASEINRYIDEFIYYCEKFHMTKGVDFVEVILNSLKGQSLDWFKRVVMKKKDFDEDDYNLKTFCQVLRQKYLPSDHLLTLFKKTITFRVNDSNPRESFDDILSNIYRLFNQINKEQFLVLLFYCLHTPTSMQELMDVNVDLKSMDTFVDSYVRYFCHYGEGKTGVDTFNFVNKPSFNTRNNYRAAKGFRPKRDKQAKPTGQFPLNKKAKRNNQNKGKCSFCHKRGHKAEKCWSKN